MLDNQPVLFAAFHYTAICVSLLFSREARLPKAHAFGQTEHDI